MIYQQINSVCKSTKSSSMEINSSKFKFQFSCIFRFFFHSQFALVTFSTMLFYKFFCWLFFCCVVVVVYRTGFPVALNSQFCVVFTIIVVIFCCQHCCCCCCIRAICIFLSRFFL